MEAESTSGLIAATGVVGLVAAVIGIVLLVVGVAIAVLRGSRTQAVAVLIASAIPFTLGCLGAVMGMVGAFGEVTRLGPAVTPEDLAGGGKVALTAVAVGTVSSVLALGGAIAAMIRSRSAAETNEV